MKNKIYIIILLAALAFPLSGSASVYKYEPANSKIIQLPPPPPRPPLPHIGNPFHRRHYHHARRHYHTTHRAHIRVRLPPHPPGPGLPPPPPRP